MATTEKKEVKVTLPDHDYFDNRQKEFAKGKYNSVYDENKRYIRSQYNFTLMTDPHIVYDVMIKDIIDQLGIKVKEKELRPTQILKTGSQNGGIPIRIVNFRNGKNVEGKADETVPFELEFEFFTKDQWTIRSFLITKTKTNTAKVVIKEVLKNERTIYGFKAGYMKRNYAKSRKLVLEYQAYKIKKELNLFDEKLLPKLEIYEKNMLAKIRRNSMLKITR